MDAEMLLKLMSVMKGAQGAGGQNNVGAEGGSFAGGGFPFGAFSAGVNGTNGGIAALLPFLLAGMNPAAQGAAQGNTQGATQNAAQQNNMLPFLLSLMGGGNPFQSLFGGGNATQRNTSDASEKGGGSFGQNGNNGYAGDDFGNGGCNRDGNSRPYGYNGARYRDGAYARNAYAARAPYSPPFDDIGFAGAEVRGFMEQLWRLRRKI